MAEATVTSGKTVRDPVFRTGADGGLYIWLESGEEGVYTLALQHGDTEKKASVYLSYAPEYETGRADAGRELLQSVSALTGGEMLAAAENVLQTEKSTAAVVHSMVLPLAVLAALLFFAELAVRRLRSKK